MLTLGKNKREADIIVFNTFSHWCQLFQIQVPVISIKVCQSLRQWIPLKRSKNIQRLIHVEKNILFCFLLFFTDSESKSQ